MIGLALNASHEKCGTPISVDSETILSAVTWPALLGMALVIDKDNLAETQCGGDK